jgi:hypothetical protein
MNDRRQENALARLGITGHMNLTAGSLPLVYQALREALAPYAGDELVGISCIARGADSVFAQVVLDLGGKLEVLLPASNYRETKVKPDHAAQFDELTRRAVTVRALPFSEANRDAYKAVNEALVSSCDRLFAIWDGQTGTDKGSTASVVEYARSQGVPVEIIWPAGAKRE